MNLRDVEIIYFKSSGKYYTTAKFQVVDSMPDFAIRSLLREWNRGKTKNSLPGLVSITWEGYMLVTPSDGVPAILDFTHENNSG